MMLGVLQQKLFLELQFYQTKPNLNTFGGGGGGVRLYRLTISYFLIVTPLSSTLNSLYLGAANHRSRDVVRAPIT